MNKGFTLVEILVVLAISGVVMTGVYSAFKSQQESYIAQEQVAEMQQTIRAALDTMTRELRMAGYTGAQGSNAGILAAQVDAISFSADLNEDGDTNDDGENIAYDRYDSATTGPLTLGRSSSNAAIALNETPLGSGHFEAAGHQPFASEVEDLEFFYTLENSSTTTSPVDPSDIRSVQMSMLVRARNPDPNYTHNQFYCPASHSSFNTSTNLCEDPDGNTMVPWGPYNDSYRRRFQTLTVKCRNMGL